MKRYQALAIAIGSKARCEEFNKDNSHMEVIKTWKASIARMMESFPSGSGFDSGTKLDDSSTGNKLVFTTAYHHMNDGGMYDGWTEHTITAKPDLEIGFRLSITGRDRNGIKEYISDMFNEALEENDLP
jgi:hypothetical protein